MILIRHFTQIHDIGINVEVIYLYYDEFTNHPQIQQIININDESYIDEPDFHNDKPKDDNLEELEDMAI